MRNLKMEMDDSISANLIDALTMFCKFRIRDISSLEEVEEESAQSLLDQIKDDNNAFIETADASEIWGAIILGYESVAIFSLATSNFSTDDIVQSLSDSSKRAYGALLCTAELIVEHSARFGPFVVKSLFKAFVAPVLFGHSNASSFLFNLLQDYKLYFPYTYTFCRRIGQSPNTTLQQWREFFNPESDVHDKDENIVQSLSVDWDMSGLEEGEDSDGEDQKSVNPPIPILSSPTHLRHKRVTRMSSSNRRDRLPASATQSSSEGMLLNRSSGDASLLEIHDMSMGSPNTSVSRSPQRDSFPISKYQRRGDGSFVEDAKPMSAADGYAAFGSNASEKVPIAVSLRSTTSASGNPSKMSHTVPEEISLGDLKAAFEQSLEHGSDLAEKGKLARILRYTAGIPSVAAAVQSFHDIELSWDEVRDLAGPYIKSSPPSSPVEGGGNSTASAYTPRKRAEDSRWGDRTLHNFMIESTDNFVRNPPPVEQQTSPYLSLPKVPPNLTPLQIGKILFEEVDKNGDRLVSQVELIRALRGNPSLAQRLKLPSHIRQEDGSRDTFVHAFHDMDSDETGDISLDEFLNFIARLTEDPRGSQPSWQHQASGQASNVSKEASVDKEDFWASRERDEPVRTSVASEDIISTKPLIWTDQSHRNTPHTQSAVSTLDLERSVESIKGDVHNLSPPAPASPANAPSGSPPNRTRSVDSPVSQPRQRNSEAVAIVSDLRTMVNRSLSNQAVNSTELTQYYRDEKGRPPLHRSYQSETEVGNSIQQLKDGRSNPSDIIKVTTTSDGRYPRPPTELGKALNVILEGWLEKKSSTLGLWQQRFFALVYISDGKFQLRIFKKAIESSWGWIPIGLSRIVESGCIEHVAMIPNKKKIDAIFTITERLRTNATSSDSSKQPNSPSARSPTQQPAIEADGDNKITVERKDSFDSLYSDDSRVITLRAIDAEARLLWVSTLRKSMGMT